MTWPGLKRSSSTRSRRWSMKSCVSDGKDGNAAQVRVERAAAVVALQLRAKVLVALQDVEHVAQHFQHHAVGLGAHRGRARVISSCTSFRRTCRRAKFSDRACRSGKIHRGVDGNERRSASSLAVVFLRGASRLCSLLKNPWLLPSRLDVSDGAGKKNFRLAFENVKGRRTELPLAANDFSCA